MKNYFHLVGVFHAIYTIQLSGKYEKVLRDICWNDAYLILGPTDQYLVNYNNTTTQIFSVTMHVGMMDMYTL